MFRYHISLGTSTRVPRDLISGNLRMVFLHHKGYSRIRARREMGGVAELSTFDSISSPLNIFYFGSQGWMGSSVKTCFIYFQKNKEVMNEF
jgi:hypothetical protein